MLCSFAAAFHDVSAQKRVMTVNASFYLLLRNLTIINVQRWHISQVQINLCFRFVWSEQNLVYFSSLNDGGGGEIVTEKATT